MSQDKDKGNKEAKIFTDAKDLLASMPAPKVEKKWCDALDGYVYMKQISAADQDAYEREMVNFVEQEDGSMKTEQRMDNMRSKYLVRVLCDAKGNRLYSDAQATQLGNKLTSTIRELHRVALEVNGIGKAQVEELEKNSNAELTGDSPSD